MKQSSSRNLRVPIGASDLHRELAELANFPYGPHQDSTALEDARNAYLCLANLLLTEGRRFPPSKSTSVSAFPKSMLEEKLRLQDLIEQLSAVPGLEEALAGVRKLPPARYTEEDWQIVRASFTLLRHAAGELKAVFAEAGTVDFVEVAQIARQVLRGEDQLPSDAALVVADDIRHLLVDEFQDTSRRQHEFISALIAAWPERSGRTIFVVGDPMQSIYFFRDAEAELFRRVKERGFEFAEEESFPLDPVRLTANFRTDPALVSSVNDAFEKVFAVPDGSGIEFAKAEPARNSIRQARRSASNFTSSSYRKQSPETPAIPTLSASGRKSRTSARPRANSRPTKSSHSFAAISIAWKPPAVAGKKYRIAVLGRARTALAPIAAALREAGIPFRAVELESLKDRPEILDAACVGPRARQSGRPRCVARRSACAVVRSESR